MCEWRAAYSGEGGAQVFQLRLLLEARGTHALPPAPPGDALFECDVVERAAAPHDRFHLLGLGGCGHELVCVALAHRLHLPTPRSEDFRRLPKKRSSSRTRTPKRLG